MTTSIEWTDETWNPVTGCTRVSEGCRHCYIERTPPFRMAGRKFVNGSTGLTLHPERLDQPLHWKKPRRVFVNSLSDLFHEDVPDYFIRNVYACMVAASWHTFQVLTKRPERRRYLLNAPSFREWVAERAAEWINVLRGDRSLPATENLAAWHAGAAGNIQEGVSIEDQKTADARIPILLRTPAAVRFVSAEPLLGPVSFRWACWDDWKDGNGARRPKVNHLDGLKKLDWVIVGGESGPGARPCHIDWIRSIRDQCQAAGVPFFFKQWGEWASGHEVDPGDGRGLTSYYFEDPHAPFKVWRFGKKRAGARLDGREWREFPR